MTINGVPSKDAFSCNRVAIPRTEPSVKSGNTSHGTISQKHLY